MKGKALGNLFGGKQLKPDTLYVNSLLLNYSFNINNPIKLLLFV